jgi:hypothetical protein
MISTNQKLLSLPQQGSACRSAISHLKGVSKMNTKILMAALFLSVALFPNISFAHNTAAGCESNSNVSISDESNWAALCSKTLTLTDGTHDCVATASAEVANPLSLQNKYLFTIAKEKNPLTNSSFERQIELNNNSGIEDPETAAVSTVRHFHLKSGTYTFYWLARPKSDADSTATVNDYSMGIVCVDGN